MLRRRGKGRGWGHGERRGRPNIHLRVAAETRQCPFGSLFGGRVRRYRSSVLAKGAVSGRKELFPSPNSHYIKAKLASFFLLCYLPPSRPAPARQYWSQIKTSDKENCRHLPPGAPYQTLAGFRRALQSLALARLGFSLRFPVPALPSDRCLSRPAAPLVLHPSVFCARNARNQHPQRAHQDSLYAQARSTTSDLVVTPAPVLPSRSLPESHSARLGPGPRPAPPRPPVPRSPLRRRHGRRHVNRQQARPAGPRQPSPRR